MSVHSETIGSLPEWLQVLGILLLAAVAAGVIRTAIAVWIRGSERFARTNLDRVILEVIDYPLYLSVVLTGVYLALQIVGLGGLEFYLRGAILTTILVLWARAGIRLGAQVVNVLQEGDREVEFAPVLKNLWSSFLLIGAFVLLLVIWQVDVTPLLASAGVLGIVLGIAARDSLGNFFAGISLHLDKTFRVGDVIQLEDGTRGTVTDLSIRSTTILTLDNIAVTVPNGQLNQTMVVNESSPQRRRRVRLDVGVAYGSDLSSVEKALLEVAAEESIVLKTPGPAVRFRSFDESAITAQLQCYIEHPALRGRARHTLILGITDAFEREEIKIPFPQREVSFFEAGNEIRLEGEADSG